MLGILLITLSLIFCGTSADVTVQGHDEMPIQSYMWDDVNVKKITSEIQDINNSVELLKVRLEDQQSLLEKKLMKMDILMNKTESAINPQKHVEIKKSLLELQTSVNEIKDQNNLMLRKTRKIPSNCAEALMGIRSSGVYTIQLNTLPSLFFRVYCEANVLGGDWTVIQRRQDGLVDFFRNWTEYKKGFGDLNGDFFIGLDKLHALTENSSQELLFVLEDFEGEIRYAKYDEFAIGGEAEGYAINILGSYSGDAGDSFTYQKYMKFTTKDRDNDIKSDGNCAKQFKGAWWYENCQESSLNGLYLKGKHDTYGSGILWYSWKGEYYSLKYVEMLIRPKAP